MSRMLYRHSEEEKPRRKKMHGLNVDTIVVEEKDVESMAREGWAKTPTLAKALYDRYVAGEFKVEPGPDSGVIEEQKRLDSERTEFEEDKRLFKEQREAATLSSEAGNSALPLDPATAGFDIEGYPWDTRINYDDGRKTQAGKWMQKPGIKKESAEQVRSEIKPKAEQEDLTEPDQG